MKKLKIIIVDDCISVCRSLSEKLNAVPEFEVVKTITDPIQAVDEIQRIRPDILILDVVMSALDGDDILESLKETLDFSLGIIIISPINNDMTISHYSKLGAHYFIPKPVNNEKLIKKIKQLHENLCQENNSLSNFSTNEISYISTLTTSNKPLSSKITRLLISIGVNPKLKGFCFLKDSIQFICLSGNELSSVTKIVYPKIAKDYGTEAEKVERAIRTAIEKAFVTENSGKFYYDTLGTCRNRKSSKQYPSNREFIFTIAEYVKNVDEIIC